MIPVPVLLATPSPLPRAILADGCGDAEAFALLLDEAVAPETAGPEEADPPPEAQDAAAIPVAPLAPNSDLPPEAEEDGGPPPAPAGVEDAANTALPSPHPEKSGQIPPDARRQLTGQPDQAAPPSATPSPEATTPGVEVDPAEALVLLRAERIEPHGKAAPSPEAAAPDREADPAESLVLLRAKQIEPRGMEAPPAAVLPAPNDPRLPAESPDATTDDRAAPVIAAPPGEPLPEGAEPVRHQVSRLPSLPPPLQPLVARITEALGPDDPGDGISLDLAADELGPLRLTIRGEGDRIEVHVMADSAGTLDLMRRHVEQLAQELRQAGYRQAEMSFGSREQGRRPQAGGAPPSGDPAPVPPVAARNTSPAAGRLDLRI